MKEEIRVAVEKVKVSKGTGMDCAVVEIMKNWRHYHN